MLWETESYFWARFLFQRGLALCYLLAFTVALRQFPGLIGRDGLLPVKKYIRGVSFRQKPSIFHWDPSDRAMKTAAFTGILLSIIALTGISEVHGGALSALNWALLYVLYLSFVNVGQIFWSYGWESMLLEAGFFAIFLGSFETATPFLLILLLRWMLFRVEFGAGLIKMRGDRCWRDLTCMDFHHETQPMVNPLSWYFHNAPEIYHRLETAFNHFVQLIVPFFYFAPQPFASIAGGLTVSTQLYLMLSGNYSWLNLLTIVLGFSTLSDGFLNSLLELPAASTSPIGTVHLGAVLLVSLSTVALSYYPVKNMLSKRQKMNAGFNRLNIANTYGAFGSVTKTRYQIVIEGTTEEDPDENDWEEYEFYGQPVDVSETPPQIAPYHLRLDWQLWFSAMRPKPQRPWFNSFMRKLAEEEEDVLKLLRKPFDEPVEKVRAKRYSYEFTSPEEREETGDTWKREELGVFYPPVSEEDFGTDHFRKM